MYRHCAHTGVVVESLEPRQLLASNGLEGVYFNNSNFTGSTVERLDKAVAYTLRPRVAPAPGIGGTTFSIRWTGLVKAYTSEATTFIVTSNDGVRLWVDGKLLVNSWKVQPVKTHSGTIDLKANRVYDIRLEHFTARHRAKTSLSWATPTRKAGFIPSSRLFAYDTRSANVGDFGFDTAREGDVAAMINKWKPDFITTNGDNDQIDGDWSDYDRAVGKYYGDYIGNYQGNYGDGSSTNRFFPAMGNHDWDADGGDIFEDYFSLPNNGRYYDVRKGPIHFFFVSSDPREPDGTSANSEQGQWVKSRMLDSDAPFKVVIFHHPPYTSGTMGDNTQMRWPFADWGADVVLNGHEHVYERLSVDGTPYITNGAGGQTVRLGSTDSHSVIRNNSDVGALLIQANEFALTLQYQQRNGSVIDTITLGAN